MIALCCGIFLPFDQFRKQFRMLLKHLPQLLKHITADLCLRMFTDFGKESCVHLLGNQLPVCIKTVGIGICYHFGLSVSCIALNGLDIAPAQFQL